MRMNFTPEQSINLLSQYQIFLDVDSYQLNSQKKVIVGMSGGVDSSVSALILKLQGFQVFGMFMKNWEEEIDGVCPAEEDYSDVVKVCELIDIPYYSINFAKEYKENVFNHFIEGYKQGLTPNPDILCNREIKFKVFFEHAMRLGADYLATGHYCRKIVQDNTSYLAKGIDGNKDQTYFLYTMKEEVLDHVLFPVGDLEKSIVRQIANDFNLATKAKKDSTGICFIGERNFKEFIQKYITSSKGNFVDLDGSILGPHDGHPFYTKGQRKGLGIGGPGGPYFVVDKNVEKNEVIVVSGEDHPALFAFELVATEISWVNKRLPTLPMKCTAKVRYRQIDVPCSVDLNCEGKLFVRFQDAQRAITEQQSIVFYQNDTCLGGAIIESVGMSLYEMGLKDQSHTADVSLTH